MEVKAMSLHGHELRPRGFLRLPQVLELYPVSPATWWRGVKNGRFPQPVKLTERTTAWRVEEVEALLESY
mgnify:FL=1